jgi:hypothetical protein
MDTVRVLVGTNPQDVLDLYLAAQKKAGQIREKISAVATELADYKARFWSSGTSPSHYDTERKALLAELREKVRARSTERKTVDAIDDEARTDRRYREFIEEGGQERWQMERLQAQVSSLHRELETALGVVEYYSKAHQASQSMIWFAREENKRTF